MTTPAARHSQLRDIKGRHWLEISLTVDSETAEAVAEVLGRFSPAGVVIEPVESVSNADFSTTVRAPVPMQNENLQLRSFLKVDGKLRYTIDKLERALWPLQMIARKSGLTPPTLQYKPLADVNWMEQWRSRYRPLRVGRRLLILPAWLQPELTSNDVPVLIDPGQAFGTGTHPTTQMCLAAIEDYLQPGDTILDLGCGSGILSIAALKLGANRAYGFDTDANTIREAYNNARANSVTDRLLLAQGSVAAVRRRANYSLVVVNILSSVIIRFLEEGLTETIAHGGIMILSGMLSEQVPEVLAAIQATDTVLLARKIARDGDSQDSKWVTLIVSTK